MKSGLIHLCLGSLLHVFHHIIQDTGLGIGFFLAGLFVPVNRLCRLINRTEHIHICGCIMGCIFQISFRLCQRFFDLTAVRSLDDQSLNSIVYGSDTLVDFCLRSLLIVIDLTGLISCPL